MSDLQPTGIAKAFAANAADEKRIRAHGYKGAIYRADEGQIPGNQKGRFRMRPGELLGVVRGYLAFGSARKDWTGAEALIHSWGAAILDLDSGLRSDRNGAKMFARALRPPRETEFYQKMAAASAEAKIAGRMPVNPARKIWFSQKMSVAEKLDLMTGWSRFAAYDKFGKTHVSEGRRKK